MNRKKLSHLFGLLVLLLLIPGQSFAQNLRVEGKVLDERGEGLIGAGVVIQGTTTGTVTDFDGNFVIPSVSRGAMLEISCIGYATQVVEVTGGKLTIAMEVDSHLIEESVVVAYGQQKKVTITGAVSAVSGEGLLKAPVANVANALQGQLPGVSAVQASGMPGDDEPTIRIRGVGSLNSADPLVLVDGVERSFSQLDPNEIESISVLKDASATAVFGVRGANGVILVTTKRGTTGKASVTASASAAIQTISKFIDFADSYTYGRMWNYTRITDALPMSQWPGTTNIADYTPYQDLDIRFSQDVMEHFRKGDMPTTFPNTDWINYIMKNSAWQEQANVNVNGGTERVRYFISAGFLNQDSLFKTFSNDKNETFKYQRLNYRANLDIDISKRSQLSITLVGRITYDYATKYLLDFNIGYNGSENFAPGKRYGLFPSVSVGWIPSSEDWWEPIKDVFGYLKIRGSWGLVGNDNTNGARFLYLPGAWQFYQGSMSTNPYARSANFGTSGDWLQAARELTSGNPNVTWETASKINVGVDAAFFKDRLHAYVDFFWEDRKDILVSNASTLPAVTSLPSSYVNSGRVKNHGFEVTLNWEDKIGDFSYSISPNFAFARNQVLEMLEVEPLYAYLKHTGLPVGQPFGYDLFEFYQPGTEERYKAAYGTEMPDQNLDLKYGDCVYVDLNGDGIIDQNDQKPLGYTSNPEITYSLNAQLHWKGLDFSMLWIGADHVSRTLRGYFRDQFGSTNTSALTQWVADNSWTEDNQNAILPRISFDNRVHNTRDSRAWMIDSKYIRLKNVEIGYTFKKRDQSAFFNYIRVYLSGQNLLTFSEFDGNDPEAPGSGLDYGVRYPMTHVFNIGAQINF